MKVFTNNPMPPELFLIEATTAGNSVGCLLVNLTICGYEVISKTETELFYMSEIGDSSFNQSNLTMVAIHDLSTVITTDEPKCHVWSYSLFELDASGLKKPYFGSVLINSANFT